MILSVAMHAESPNPLQYEIPTKPGTSVQVQRFPDGGVTVVVPPLLPQKPTNLVGVAVVIAIATGVLVFVAGVSRAPFAILLAAAFLAASCVGFVLDYLVKSGSEVIGISPRSAYICWRNGRRFETPLINLKSIKIKCGEGGFDETPEAVQFDFAESGKLRSYYLCHGRTKQEIVSVTQVLKESWESLLDIHHAPLRQAIAEFLTLCQTDPKADDHELFRGLCGRGIDRSLAIRLLLMVPIACVRVVQKDAASFHGYCLIVDEQGKPLRRDYFNQDDVFQQAGLILAKLKEGQSSDDLLKHIAGRSTEAAMFLERLQRSSPGEKPSLPPPRIPKTWFQSFG